MSGKEAVATTDANPRARPPDRHGDAAWPVDELELKTRSDLAVQESRQQVNALREQVVQMRQKPTTQGAAYDHSDWVNAPSARSWHLYHVLHGQIDFGDAETAYYSSETM